MRLKEAVASALHLLIIFSYFFLAAFIFLLPSRPDWRVEAIRWLEDGSEPFYAAGAILCSIGLFFLIGFFFIGRGRFLRVSMRSTPVSIDAKVIRLAIEDCFRKNFPSKVQGAHVVVAGERRLEVALDTSCPEEQQLEFLAEAEKKLVKLLQDRFGYSDALSVTVRSK